MDGEHKGPSRDLSLARPGTFLLSLLSPLHRSLRLLLRGLHGLLRYGRLFE